MTSATKTPEQIGPPPQPAFVEWARKNLFSSWYNALLSVLSMALVVWVAFVTLRWVFVGADWSPITDNILLYLIGQFPRDLIWRIGIAIAVFTLLTGVSLAMFGGLIRAFAWTLAVVYVFLAVIPSTGGSFYPTALRVFFAAMPALLYASNWIAKRRPPKTSYLALAWGLSVVLDLFLLRGLDLFGNLLVGVPVNLWGGLIVTILLAVGGIVISFPIGVLLALGRRSSLPVVRVFSTTFIEGVRGVPLITILFLGSLLVPLFLPQEMRIDRLVRALIGMTIFSAAYTAENIRGGLQAIPQGQYEAADALALSGFHTTTFIILPQAIRLVIPAIVGQFISLFKDTTLASGVAVLEILLIGRSVLNSEPSYVTLQFEVFGFIGLVFWIFSYAMSASSRQVEERLGVGQR